MRPPSGGRASFEEVRGGGGSNVWRSGEDFRERRIASGFEMVESRNRLDYGLRSDGTGTSEFRRKTRLPACA